MKIFLDTANLDEIRQGVALGVVDGITMNPTLVAKENRPFREHVLQVCDIVKGGVSQHNNCQNGPHTASSKGPFGLTVWGEDSAASYGYPAGGNLATINSVVVPPVPH